MLTGSPVHVWVVGLDPEAGRLAGAADLLAPDENARAARYVSPIDRRRFVAARSALRHILAYYAGTPPAGLRFVAGAGGKPALAGHPGLHFSLSHSADCALVAVSAGGPVGVDVERVRRVDDLDRVAELVLTPRERRHVRAAHGPDRLDRFLACWTRKEAYVKALGRGLVHPVDRVDVLAAPDRSGFAPVHDPLTAPARWFVRDLDPAPGHVGAVALPVPGLGVRLRRFDPAYPVPGPPSTR